MKMKNEERRRGKNEERKTIVEGGKRKGEMGGKQGNSEEGMR